MKSFTILYNFEQKKNTTKDPNDEVGKRKREKKKEKIKQKVLNMNQEVDGTCKKGNSL